MWVRFTVRVREEGGEGQEGSKRESAREETARIRKEVEPSKARCCFPLVLRPMN